MAVTVKITETYDMKTSVNKMGLVGVHTPTNNLLKKLYPGLMKNHKFVRFVKCDVVGACASVLPADPLQIGVSEGTVAPEDMFNPILYTAVSNESFDTLVARVRNLTDVSALNSVSAGDAWSGVPTDFNFQSYYGLLAENGRFRKVMPQSGFRINGLVPLAHTVISTFGNVGSIGDTTALASDGENEVYVPDMDVPEVASGGSNTSGVEIFYRGKSIKMPRIALHTGQEGLDDIPNPNIPETMVLAMILPPARLHEFFYRMRVTWTVRFEQVITALEASSPSVLSTVGLASYARSYSFDSSKANLENNTDMVSTDNVDINKIMES